MYVVQTDQYTASEILFTLPSPVILFVRWIFRCRVLQVVLTDKVLYFTIIYEVVADGWPVVQIGHVWSHLFGLLLELHHFIASGYRTAVTTHLWTSHKQWTANPQDVCIKWRSVFEFSSVFCSGSSRTRYGNAPKSLLLWRHILYLADFMIMISSAWRWYEREESRYMAVFVSYFVCSRQHCLLAS